MEHHIDVCMKVYKIIETCYKSVHLCQLKFWKFASVNFILNCSRDCPKCCIQSSCLQVTFMFGVHITSKFAQIFILKTEVRRLHCYAS